MEGDGGLYRETTRQHGSSYYYLADTENGFLSINIDPYRRIKKFTKVSALTIHKKSGGEDRRP
jgi:hypothetical protein